MKLKKLLLSSILVANTLFAGAHGTEWGYEGHNSAENWGDLTPEYGKCKSGKNQSPINIITTEVKHSDHQNAITFKYETPAVEIINNGHTVQLNIEKGSSITVNGTTYLLKQFHFHTPSENQVNGENFPLEAHFVHVSDAGNLAVVGVLFNEGVENPTIKNIWRKMPLKKDGKSDIYIDQDDINALLPVKRDYYSFTGSLTTPPCSENVKWMVMKNYATVSGPEVREFLHTLHFENNRPVQEINSRVISD